MNTKQKLYVLELIGVLATLYFFAWWFELNRLYHPLLLTLFILAGVYSCAQLFFVWYIYLNIKRPDKVQSVSGLSVAIFVPVYNEPEWMVRRTLEAAKSVRYPHQTYLIDDSPESDYREIAEDLGTIYLSRSHNADHKAGNINFALAHSTGDFVAILDIDHVPNADFLDLTLGHFRDPKIGFVQAILSHYNQSDSYVAAAAAQRNDGFFGPAVLGLEGCGCVQAFGSNCVFRREALDSIGGYKTGLAEDLNTSIQLHAKGWHSKYVPEIVAHGMEPADLPSFYIQQSKWSQGLFEILWRIYPRMVRKLSLKMNVCYFWRLTCFLAGPAIAIHILSTIFILLQGSDIGAAYFSDYLKHGVPVFIMYFLINRFVEKKYGVSPASTVFPLNGFLLAFGSWPVYSFSFFASLIGVKIPFNATPKEPQGGSFLRPIIPQLATVILLLVAIFWRVNGKFNYDSIIILAFAVFNILMHGGVFYAAYESSRRYIIAHKKETRQPQRGSNHNRNGNPATFEQVKAVKTN